MKLLLKKTAEKIRFFNAYAIALICLCLITAFFEYAPVVQEARKSFPGAFGNACDCACVLKSRPWYGQVNPWLWFWIVATPLITFLTTPAAPAWQRAGRHLLILILSWAVLYIAAVTLFEIHNTPFHHTEITANSTPMEAFKLSCYASDGLLSALSVILGWVPALIYTGWWEIAWGAYHTRKTKLITPDFKRDWVSKTVVFLSLALPILISLWLAAVRIKL